MSFDRRDMNGINYNWDQNTEKAKARYRGEPSRRSFDRFNGDQVLFIINFYGSFSEDFTTLQARIIEWEIANHLPLEIKSEISVFNWIRDTVMQKNVS